VADEDAPASKPPNDGIGGNLAPGRQLSMRETPPFVRARNVVHGTCDYGMGGAAMRLRIGIVVLVSVLVYAVAGTTPAQAEDLTVTITSPANGSTGPSDISVTGTSNADPAAYRLVLVVNGEDRYGTLQLDGTFEMAYQQFDYGWNTLCAQIRNLDLNVTYASYCSAYRVLPSDLQLFITSPSDGVTVDPTVTISGYVNYESTIKVYVDGSGPTVLQGVTGSFVYDGGYIVDGTYTTTFEAMDIYGRTATASVTFTVDGTPPRTPTVTSPSPKRVITTKEFTVTGAGEPLTHVEIRNASGEVTGTTDVADDGTWAYTFTAHELGSYYTGRRTSFTFAVAGYDNAVNYSAVGSYTYTLKIAP
jgi:Bacterial Ig domain